MKKIAIVALFLSYISAYCQSDLDSSYFNSKKEIQLFNDYDNETAFDLLYLIDSKESSSKLEKDKASFFNYLNTLATKISKKKNKRVATMIYESIHDKYFTKYVDNPIFSDIFNLREYNCVTATALYAIALNHLKIPYEIKEMPTHVYLVAFPKTDKILFETTTPQAGTFDVKQKQIEEYKNYLIENKLITSAEANNEDFFRKHYLQDSTITIKQLIAVQYYNNSIKYAEKENHKKALHQVEKAYHFYQTGYIKDWMNYFWCSG